jgi:hypothetical protein
MRTFNLALSVFVASATGYTIHSPTSATSSRRDMFRSVATVAGTALLSGAVVAVGNANAMEACPKGSSNCIRTTWTPPAGMSKTDAAASLQKVLAAYPQEGQEKVDLGGWTVAENNFASGTARLEYKSGIGNFAKFLNGGKPFIDDLKVEIEDSGVVQVRSSSRVGDSDLGVNKKRLDYLVKDLTAAGWSCPTPTY